MTRGALTLSGLTLADGSDVTGGAIDDTSSGTLSLDHMVVTGNAATGDPTLSGSAAIALGGAVYASDGRGDGQRQHVHRQHRRRCRRRRSESGGGYGGGIYASAGAVTISGSTFTGNSAGGAGGGGISSGLGRAAESMRSRAR